MLAKRIVRLITLSIVLGVILGASAVVLAAGETFQVVSVNTLGCNSGQFGMTVERANLDGGTYYVHTRVTVDGVIYMSELASISFNGLTAWNIFNNNSYGDVPVLGTYPIPSGRTMQLDFTLERPVGTILYTWRLVVDGCDTGNIQFNGIPATAGCSLNVPSGSVVGEAPLGAQIYYAPGQISSGLQLNPGTYIVTGQDSSETYYQVVLACQLIWVRKDTMQPSYQAPQNGAALPTRIVG